MAPFGGKAMNSTVEQLRAAKALIDTPEKLQLLRDLAKMQWFKICVMNDNLDSDGIIYGLEAEIDRLDRAIADAEQSEVQDA
jgi:hypothetical protein